MKILFIELATVLCTIKMLIQLCKCIELVDLSDSEQGLRKYKIPVRYENFKPVDGPPSSIRRYWLLNEDSQITKYTPPQPRVYEDEKDSNIKQKIAMLVNQTLTDAQKKMKIVDELKDEHREESTYRIGFILSMIRKSKNVLDELFNVAIKHKDQWKALEQLKVFELIVHTNVDTTNLVRQLVDVHVKHMNATNGVKGFLLL